MASLRIVGFTLGEHRLPPAEVHRRDAVVTPRTRMVGLADAGRTVTYVPPRREDLVVSGLGDPRTLERPHLARDQRGNAARTAGRADRRLGSRGDCPAIDVQPRRPTLTPKKGDDREPRPSTLATQEIR